MVRVVLRLLGARHSTLCGTAACSTVGVAHYLSPELFAIRETEEQHGMATELEPRARQAVKPARLRQWERRLAERMAKAAPSPGSNSRGWDGEGAGAGHNSSEAGSGREGGGAAGSDAKTAAFQHSSGRAPKFAHATFYRGKVSSKDHVSAKKAATAAAAAAATTDAATGLPPLEASAHAAAVMPEAGHAAPAHQQGKRARSR